MNTIPGAKWLVRALMVLGWLAVIVGGDRLAASLLRHTLADSQFRYSQLYHGAQQNDVLIFGNSRGYNSIQPSTLTADTGLSAANLSYNGMSATLAEAIFLDYLDHNRAPKSILVEVTDAGEPPDSVLSDLKPFASGSPRLMRLLRDYKPKDYYASQLSHLYLFDSEMFLRALYYLRKPDRQSAIARTLDAQTLAPLLALSAKPLNTEPKNLEALRRMVTVAHEKQIAVQLYVAPYVPQYAQRLNLPAFIARLQGVLAGEHISNYAETISDISCFADRIHLNAKGCLLFTRQMEADASFASAGTRGATAGQKLPSAN